MVNGVLKKSAKNKMKIIDFHTHIYPEKIAKKAAEAVCAYYSLKEGMEGNVSLLLNKGKEAGISSFVLLPVATKAQNVRSINNFILEEQKLHKEFYAFGTLHAELGEEGLLSEIDFIIQKGLKGIKLHSDQQKTAIDDERLFPVYDYLQEKLPVLFHCGDPVSDLSHPERLKKVLKMFPRLKVIAAHLGGWSLFEEAVSVLRGENFYYDISSCLYFLSPEKLKHYINIYGAENGLFGSDFPMWNPVTEVERFNRIPLSIAERELLSYRNAERILGIGE